MSKARIAALLSALPFAALTAVPEHASGPGGVMTAVDAFSRAIDANDAAALGAICVAPDPGHVARITDGGRVEEVDSGAEEQFVDVDAAGRTVAAADATAFAQRFLGPVRAHGDGPPLQRTTIDAVRAHCASKAASWAIVDLVREYGSGDEVEKRIPLRATVLLRYVDGGRFRVFHWHASKR